MIINISGTSSRFGKACRVNMVIIMDSDIFHVRIKVKIKFSRDLFSYFESSSDCR